MANKIRAREGSEAALAFRLPRTLHDKLKEAAGGRSVSEEMRERLERSLAQGADQKTRRLLDGIVAMTDVERLRPLAMMLGYEPPPGLWHEDPAYCKALALNLVGLVRALAPEAWKKGEEIGSEDASFKLLFAAVAGMGATAALGETKP
jgi:hypothetical protein